MYNVLIINVDELWLKGKNRPVYYKALSHHVRELLKAYHPEPFTSTREEQRIVARSNVPFTEEAFKALLRVPGVHSVAPARQTAANYDDIFPVVKEELESLETLPATYKVETKRSHKGFPMTSIEVSQAIGGEIKTVFPSLNADMRNPELVVELRILEKNIFISSRRTKAIGGLPFNTSGHLLSLLSGGFDSPVASVCMAKRGCRLSFVFFYAYPFVGDDVKDKILRLSQVLGQYQRHCHLYVVPFGNVQNEITKHCRIEYRTLLFRKAMLETSNLLARRINADALVTGDALGQVSSQTIGNMRALDYFSKLPIFRPLVGYNKVEIINLAKKFGTHDISIIPHDDACSLFAPKHPIIRPDWVYLKQFDDSLNMDEQLEKCLDEMEIYDISVTGEIKLKNK